MGFFQRLFGARSATDELSRESAEAATRFLADPASESGLSEGAEKAITALALTQNFRELELALRHPSPQARAFTVGLVAVAGRVEPSGGGGVSFEINSDGNAIGKCDRRALALLKKSTKDPNLSVRTRAQEEIARCK